LTKRQSVRRGRRCPRKELTERPRRHLPLTLGPFTRRRCVYVLQGLIRDSGLGTRCRADPSLNGAKPGSNPCIPTAAISSAPEGDRVASVKGSLSAARAAIDSRHRRVAGLAAIFVAAVEGASRRSCVHQFVSLRFRLLAFEHHRESRWHYHLDEHGFADLYGNKRVRRVRSGAAHAKVRPSPSR
jgi:hypothetical protein